MAKHVHGCLDCRPDMVPDHEASDPRFHDYPKCGITFRVTLDGADQGYTRGAFEGREGWVLCAGATVDDVHVCPCGSDTVCVEPRFGAVAVSHNCPAVRGSR